MDGSARVYSDLVAHGIRCSRRRVSRLMAGLALCGCLRNGQCARSTNRTGPAHCKPALDLVRRAFAVDAVAHIEHVWVADTAAISAGEGWPHRAVVLDLRSRRVVGWSMFDALVAILTGDAFRMALGRRRPHHGLGLIHYYDPGSTYTAASLQARLREAEIACSVGPHGHVSGQRRLRPYRRSSP